ncbi:MAG TPA: hemerythrin domain-containing protein [Steroidobacteraceae bacterium]|nr:hemerythrin domain-containing protein [Steroidobacteraceae bacterium]
MIESGSSESLSREDPAHIERHIDATRQEVDRTLDELQSRLSVRRRMSEALDSMTPDITRMIRLDHTHVLAAFRRFRSRMPESRKRALVENVCLALEVHAQLEEEIFYPAMRAIAAAGEILDKSVPEHEEMRGQIRTLRGMEPFDAAYNETFRKLIRTVLHHVADEETTLLPLAEELMPDELGHLGRVMTRRRIELLRPHAAEAAATTIRTFPIGAAAAAAGVLGVAWLLLRGLARAASRSA